MFCKHYLPTSQSFRLEIQSVDGSVKAYARPVHLLWMDFYGR